MLLAIDIGNTNIVFGVFDGPKLQFSARAGTSVQKTEDEWAIFLERILAMKGQGVGHIDRAIMCSVVPPVSKALCAATRNGLGIDTMVVGPGIKTGMSILYENPKEVGTDRVVNAVAASRFYGVPAVVVDFGTAVTFDAINKRGDYLGGAILPGITLGAQALFSRTSKLPMVDIARTDSVIGRNTIASMQAGLYYGYVSLVQGMIERFLQELGKDTRVVATGGQAQLICHECPCVQAIDPDLTLKGLQYLSQINS